MEHENANILKRLFDAFASRDLDAISAGLAEDVSWHTPGRSQLAGEHVGRDAVLAHLSHSAELSEGSYRIEIEDIMASDRHASVLYRATGSRQGRHLDLRHLALYEVANEMVQAVWVTPFDQLAFDAFWA